MANKKPVRMKMGASPKGVAVYPRLNKPDTKFDVDGVYKLGLRVDPNDPEVVAYVEKLNAFAAANPQEVGKNTNSPVKDEVDDKGVPTGMVVIQYKVAAAWKDGTSRKPAIVGADKKPLASAVGGGSIVRVSAEAATYEGFGGGITLAPKAVQVLKLETWNAGVDDFADESDGTDMPPHDGGGDDEPEF